MTDEVARTSKTMLFPWRFARDESPPRNVPVLVAWRRGSGWQFDVAKFGGKRWLEVLPDAPNNEFFAPPHYWRTIDSPDDVCAAVPSDETSDRLRTAEIILAQALQCDGYTEQHGEWMRQAMEFLGPRTSVKASEVRAVVMPSVCGKPMPEGKGAGQCINVPGHEGECDDMPL